MRGTAYEPALNFPLLIKHPRIEKPIIVEDLVQTVDLMPGILAMLEVPDDQEILREGRPFAFSVFGDMSANEYAYAASTFLPDAKNQSFQLPTSAEVIRNREWKLIKNVIYTETGLRTASTTYELYNIKGDPYETRDLFAYERERGRDMLRTLEHWLRIFSDVSSPL